MTLLLNSCIDPFKPDLAKNDLESQLVVEGTITDEPGPFKVRLTKSGSIYPIQYSDKVVYNPEPVSGADVHITDDKGNDFHLYQGVNGWYETIDTCLQGVPGNTYTLQITDADGNRFESTPELMMEVPPIESLFFEEKQRISIKRDEVSQELWLDILLNTRMPADGIHYLKWEFEETWEFKMPEYIRVDKRFSDSPTCIGRAGESIPIMTWVTIPPEQFHCWGSEASKSILVKSTVDNLTGEIKSFPLISIGPEDDRLSIRYSILVKQYSLNKELYDFFKKLENLNETNGGMYDKMPSPLYGNIQSLSGDKKVLGFFLVSTVKTKRIFIDNRDVHVKTGHNAYFSCGWVAPPLCMFPYYYYGKIVDNGTYIGTNVWSTEKFCTDCRERGKSVKPDFW